MKAISGSLFSLDVLQGFATDRPRGRALCSLVGRALDAIGPSSASRQVADRMARPLLESVGLDTAFAEDAGEFIALRASAENSDRASLLGTSRAV